MSRFYWILGIASGLVAAAWTVSAQPTPPNAPPPGVRPVPAMMGFPPPPGFPANPFVIGFPPPPGFPPGPAMMGLQPPPPVAAALASGWAPPAARPEWGPSPPARPAATEACLDMMAHRAADRAYLRVKLDLTPQQLPAWQELETVSSQGEAEERQFCASLPAKPDELLLVQRLDKAEERATRQLAHLRKVGESFKKLAATLSPEQQRLIDQSMPPLPF